MPCQSFTREEMDQQTITSLKHRLDEVTRLLCYACSALKTCKIPVEAELILWYEQHLREDADRLRQEELQKKKNETAKDRKQRREAIRKRLATQLTPEELDALGLKAEKP